MLINNSMTIYTPEYEITYCYQLLKNISGDTGTEITINGEKYLFEKELIPGAREILRMIIQKKKSVKQSTFEEKIALNKLL